MTRLRPGINPAARIRCFLGDEGGFVTHFALTVMILVILFAGLSVDTANAWRTRTHLQAAADAAAHAAVLALPDKKAALKAALELAGDNLGSRSRAIVANQVQFGHWNPRKRSFKKDATPLDAVRVVAMRAGTDSVPTFFLKFAGFKSWNVTVESVAYRQTDACVKPDISANGKITLYKENEFYKSYCIEAAERVVLKDDNRFDDNNRIIVPALSDVSLPGGVTLSTQVGRGTADSSTTLTYRDVVETKSPIAAPYVGNVDALARKYLDPLYEGQPAYINTTAPVIKLPARDVRYTTFQPGRIYNITCDSSGTAQFYKETEARQVVIVSQCAMRIGKESKFQDVVLISTASGAQSIRFAKEVRLGRNDDCASGGGVEIYAAGDVVSDKELKVNGVYISAKGSVSLRNRENGIRGLTIAAAGNVSIRNKARFGTCKGSKEDNLTVAYVLVK